MTKRCIDRSQLSHFSWTGKALQSVFDDIITVYVQEKSFTLFLRGAEVTLGNIKTRFKEEKFVEVVRLKGNHSTWCY